MLAGTAKIDITPSHEVWMDGMIRSHRSAGIHDPLSARALVLANGAERAEAYAIVSVDVCALSTEQCDAARRATERETGIPASQIMVATTHTHSGPATLGIFNPSEVQYVEGLLGKIASVVKEATGAMQPAAVGARSGSEDTISHYRRLLADDGTIVMNWESFPPQRIVGPLGEVDTEVGVIKVVAADAPDSVLGLLFNHAGHPNVLSGDNYLLSAEYPGLAERLLEEEFGGTALFVNGAQGTMDIDGLRDRDWEGMARAGRALADAVSQTARHITPAATAAIRGASAPYHIPARKITAEQLAWAEGMLAETGGDIQARIDGVGDDYKATLYKHLHDIQDQYILIEQLCFAIDDAALLGFPGELFTEIGVAIKKHSPFEHTYVVGLANGSVGYVPTRKAISEGGYAVDTRRVDASAEDIIREQSLALLQRCHDLS